MSRRLPRLFALVVVACVLATAPWAIAQETPVSGGTLVVVHTADPGHLNPAITTGGPTHTAAELLYNGLVGRDERGAPTPELAERWTVEQGGTVYRFRLRNGVTWPSPHWCSPPANSCSPRVWCERDSSRP